MVNYEELENYLKDEQKVFFYHTMIYKYDDIVKMRELRKINNGKFMKCFEKCENTKEARENFKWSYEAKCRKCGKIFLKRDRTKADFIDYIILGGKYSDGWHLEDNHLCNECISKLKAEEQQQINENNKNIEEIKTYLLSYYNSNYSLKEGWRDDFSSIVNEVFNIFYYFTESDIKRIVEQLDYKEYLKTSYWKVTRERALRKAHYKCQLCNSNENLNVHHKTYEHKGSEIRHMDDLIVLCQKCHSKFHEIGE